MEIRNVIVLIVLGLIFLGAGVGIGVFYQLQKTSPSVVSPNQTTTVTSPLIKDLSSKVISSISSYGVVTKIDGNNLTLAYQGDTMTVTVTNTAKLYSFITPSTTVKANSSSHVITLSDIKVGNSVSIALKLSPTGQLQGYSVVVLPPESQATTNTVNAPMTKPVTKSPVKK